jgi:hypothetical protein
MHGNEIKDNDHNIPMAPIEEDVHESKIGDASQMNY